MKSKSKISANVSILGAQIQALRISKGLTRKELCRMAGVSPAFLYDIEHGLLGNPSLAHVEAVATALGTDVVSLLSVSEGGGQDKIVLRFSSPPGVELTLEDISTAQRIMQEVLNALAKERTMGKRTGRERGQKDSTGNGE